MYIAECEHMWLHAPLSYTQITTLPPPTIYRQNATCPLTPAQEGKQEQ